MDFLHDFEPGEVPRSYLNDFSRTNKYFNALSEQTTALHNVILVVLTSQGSPQRTLPVIRRLLQRTAASRRSLYLKITGRRADDETAHLLFIEHGARLASLHFAGGKDDRPSEIIKSQYVLPRLHSIYLEGSNYQANMIPALDAPNLECWAQHSGPFKSLKNASGAKYDAPLRILRLSHSELQGSAGHISFEQLYKFRQTLTSLSFAPSSRHPYVRMTEKGLETLSFTHLRELAIPLTRKAIEFLDKVELPSLSTLALTMPAHTGPVPLPATLRPFCRVRKLEWHPQLDAAQEDAFERFLESCPNVEELVLTHAVKDGGNRDVISAQTLQLLQPLLEKGNSRPVVYVRGLEKLSVDEISVPLLHELVLLRQPVLKAVTVSILKNLNRLHWPLLQAIHHTIDFTVPG